MKIFLVEDNEELNFFITDTFKKIGYEVLSCIGDNSKKVFDVVDVFFDLYIIDINLPSINGLELVKKIKANRSDAKIFIISGDDNIDTILNAYDLGCDDYIKKPFFILELVQKIKKLCVVQKKFLKFSNECKYDFINHILYENESEIELTKKEILFLELFSKNLHHVASYEEIEEYVWEGEETNLTNIRAMIKRLRKKIPNEAIVIVKGMGYSLYKEVQLV